MNRFIGLILLSFMFFPIAVRAQCTNPPAEMGVLIMNKAHKVMQYCNGDDWIGLWGGGGGSGNGDGTPSGAIMAFDLADCPSGWSPYGPSSGRFLRGRCIAGETCNDADGVRVAGSMQSDAIAAHNHKIRMAAGLGSLSNAGSYVVGSGPSMVSYQQNFYTGTGASSYYGSGAELTGTTVASETRPKNTAVLYCRKN